MVEIVKTMIRNTAFTPESVIRTKPRPSLRGKAWHLSRRSVVVTYHAVVRITSTYRGIFEIYETLRFMRHICDGCYITVTPPFCNLPREFILSSTHNLSSLASSSLAPCFPRQSICNLSSLAVSLHSP